MLKRLIIFASCTTQPVGEFVTLSGRNKHYDDVLAKLESAIAENISE